MGTEILFTVNTVDLFYFATAKSKSKPNLKLYVNDYNLHVPGHKSMLLKQLFDAKL